MVEGGESERRRGKGRGGRERERKEEKAVVYDKHTIYSQVAVSVLWFT